MADQTLPIGGALDITPQNAERQTLFEWLSEWVITVDHKKLGILYIMYALVFLLVAGVEALMMRIQLAVPEQSFCFAASCITGCSPCTARRWCSSWACRFCSASRIISCRS